MNNGGGCVTGMAFETSSSLINGEDLSWRE